MPELGAHVSAAGGPQNAPERGREIGCDCIQLFTRNQRSWQVKPISDEEATAFRQARPAQGIGSVMSHASYLINLAATDADKHAKAQAGLEAELERCHKLGIELLNFHPGSHTGAGMAKGIATIAETLNAICRNHPEKDDVTLVLENVAGQGTSVGADFRDLAAILERLEAPERFGVCVDTAHAFAAGYALHTAEGWDAMWQAFDEALGLEQLVGLHLNDSRPGCGSRKDRHALLGRGAIGPDAFQRAVTDPRTRAVPQFLETPAGPAGWAEEIRWLRACTQGTAPPPLPEIEDSGAQS